jgi:RNA polymerase-associated protein
VYPYNHFFQKTEKDEKGKAEEAENDRNKLRNDIHTLGTVFASYEYFMSEEFSLIDCYLAPLLWRLPQLGIDLIGPGSKELKIYMSRVFERDSFLASLTEAEREMRLSR